MGGKRRHDAGSFVTNREVYRTAIDAADSGVLSVEETLDLRFSRAVEEAQPNQYGKDLVLFAYLLLGGFSSIDVELWIKAEEEPLAADEEESSSSASVTWVRPDRSLPFPLRSSPGGRTPNWRVECR